MGFGGERVKPVIRYPGAKWRLAQWIISHFPPHTTYLEPYVGSGAVILNKPRSHCETINDIDGDITNLFKVIRENTEELAKMIYMTPWSRQEYNLSYEKTGIELEDARRFLVRLWMAHGTRTNTKTGWRSDVQGKQGSSVAKVWTKLPDRILKVAERLRGVQIENQTDLEVIGRYKFKEVLIYADPPYLLYTRSQKMYANEMTEQQHILLLDALDDHPGPVILSGYDNELYNERLKQWKRKTISALADKGRLREEVVWINPVSTEGMRNIFNF